MTGPVDRLERYEALPVGCPILDLCEPSTKRGSRNRALITTMWRSGLRVSEALALIPYQVDFDVNTITVPKKGPRCKLNWN